jgi:hypothetical protein
VEQYAARFDRPLSAPTFDPGVWARGVVGRETRATPLRFGDAIELLGYQLYAEDPRPGGVVRLDLFWLPRVASDEKYRIDVQVGQAPRIGDGGGPACDKTRAEQDWVAGEPFVQRVSVPLAADAPAGSYPLLVSVSRLGPGGGPLSVVGGASGPARPVTIGEVEVTDGGPSR